MRDCRLNEEGEIERWSRNGLSLAVRRIHLAPALSLSAYVYDETQHHDHSYPSLPAAYLSLSCVWGRADRLELEEERVQDLWEGAITMTPSITKQEILAKYRERFNDFPTSAMWYEPVLDFLSQSLDRVAQQTRESLIEEVQQMVKDFKSLKKDGGKDWNKIYYEALLDVIAYLDKLTSQEKKEECRCQGHSSVYPLSRHAINCPMFEKVKEK